MKKLFILLAAAVMAINVMAQVEVKFMGIPVSYSYEQFISELGQKVQLEYHYSTSDEYKGTFAGIEDCGIGVEKDESGDVKQIIVDKNLWRAPADIQTLKLKYDTKYGAPISDREDRDNTHYYTYKAGDTQIELILEYGDRYDPSRVTSFVIIYQPRKFQGFSTDDI